VAGPSKSKKGQKGERDLESQYGANRDSSSHEQQRSHPARNEVCSKVSAVPYTRKKARVGISDFLQAISSRFEFEGPKGVAPLALAGP
jgi:hypothetical protein